MKRLILLFFCFCMSSMVWAKEYALVIDFADGAELTLALSRLPVLTFDDGRLRVTVEGHKSEFELSDVLRFHFRNESSDIRTLENDDDLAVGWRGDDLIVISNIAPDAEILLYAVDGTVYSNRAIACGDHIEVSLSSLPKGIYLLNINNQRTLKIYRK